MGTPERGRPLRLPEWWPCRRPDRLGRQRQLGRAERPDQRPLDPPRGTGRSLRHQLDLHRQPRHPQLALLPHQAGLEPEPAADSRRLRAHPLLRGGRQHDPAAQAGHPPVQPTRAHRLSGDPGGVGSGGHQQQLLQPDRCQLQGRHPATAGMEPGRHHLSFHRAGGRRQGQNPGVRRQRRAPRSADRADHRQPGAGPEEQLDPRPGEQDQCRAEPDPRRPAER